MATITELCGRVLAIDTAPLIYYIEQSQYIEVLDELFGEVHRGEIKLVASVVMLMEVLVLPLKNGDLALAGRYNDILLTSPNTEIVSVTAPIAQLAAEIRADSGIKSPDAIQAATAIYSSAALLTNDRDLSRVSQLEVFSLRDISPA